ncbi:hypothetical protein L0663_12650 [Dyadobacter sp. CY107]|uniref:hypothetical protein n=1 Tax=Dyadobacter fanqingshengii TaxID=2906443 RepID=UPI001F1BA2C7|nr:hypothetical protein [Dyadobacter fanqingshengii]MCF2504233.1 hypothetical protein [Dyadobacter fanqingshengii]
MIDFLEIKKYAVSTPDVWSCLGSPQNFEKLPQVHREQIFFLRPDASNIVLDFLRNSDIINGYSQSKYHPLTWQPFSKAYFKSIEKLILLSNESEVKKWLFDCEIPFRRDVFLVTDSENVIVTSWKIIVKYSPLIFDDGYAIVFDESINWCLYNGNGQVYFGKNNMLFRSLKSKSFKVLESFFLSKIGLLLLIDTGGYNVKENDILFSNPDTLEWIVINEYNVTDSPLTSFLRGNRQNENGKKLYLISPINGQHKPVKDAIIFLKTT